MEKKTYGDKQREAQQLKKLEELRARAAKNSPTPDSSETAAAVPDKTEAAKKTPKADKRVRRPA
jgi:hypothetical protein